MKKVKLIKKFIICLLCIVLTSILTSSVFATEQQHNREEITISTTAGQNGFFEHDPITDSTVFVPGDEYDDEISLPVAASELEQDDDSSIVPFGIIGTDNRTAVNSPSGRYESTCLIGARFGNDVYKGTGWLINNQYVATVAHMLYRSDYGYADHVAVYVGASGGSFKQYRLGRSYTIGGDYILNNESPLDDWGVIKLDSAITVSVNKLGRYGVNGYNDMKDRTYYTQGYPGDLNKNNNPWDKWVMYTTSGSITSDRTRFLPSVWCDLDITPGQSGSPVYSYRSGYGYAAEGIVTSSGVYSNGIILINNWLMNYFNSL